MSDSLNKFSKPPLKWAKKGHRGCPAEPFLRQQSQSPSSTVTPKKSPIKASGGSASGSAADHKNVGDGDGKISKKDSILKFSIRIGKQNCAESVDDKKGQTVLPQKRANPCQDKGVSTEIPKSEKVGPWNLRPRGKKGEAKKVEEKKTQIRSDPYANSDPAPKKEIKFSISLTPEEIEADFLIMTGSKPPKKPNRRPRIIQKKLDNSFPATALPSSVTRDDYI